MYQRLSTGVSALTHALAEVDPVPAEARSLISLAEAIAYSIPPRIAPRQLLVDISVLVQRDLKVAFSVRCAAYFRKGCYSHLKIIMWNLSMRLRGNSATAMPGNSRLSFLGCSGCGLSDEVITYRAGDYFFGLDPKTEVVFEQRNFYQHLRQEGITVMFLVHDVLPITMPSYFPDGARDLFQKWFDIVISCDGVVCVSEATASDVRSLLDQTKRNNLQRPFKLAVGTMVVI